jgi:hypothetical protein
MPSGAKATSSARTSGVCTTAPAFAAECNWSLACAAEALPCAISKPTPNKRQAAPLGLNARQSTAKMAASAVDKNMVSVKYSPGAHAQDQAGLSQLAPKP